MASYTIKNIPPPLYKRLKRLAVLHHRSMNSEIIETLERATTAVKVDPGMILTLAREMRSHVGGQLTDESLRGLKDAGRS